MRFQDLPQGRGLVIRNDDGQFYLTTSALTATPVAPQDDEWKGKSMFACAATFAPDDEVQIVDNGAMRYALDGQALSCPRLAAILAELEMEPDDADRRAAAARYLEPGESLELVLNRGRRKTTLTRIA